MLDHYIRTYIQPGQALILYADNCPAHNKNKYLIGYLTYMVKIEKYLSSAELYFLTLGHTKFGPDSNFGTIKSKFRKSVCNSIKDLVGPEGIIESSAANNKVLPYKDPNTGQILFQWQNWKVFLGKIILNCPEISSWHVMKIGQEGNYIKMSPSINVSLLNNHGGEYF